MLRNNISRFRCYSKFKYRKKERYGRDIYNFRAMGETDSRSLRSDHKMKTTKTTKRAKQVKADFHEPNASNRWNNGNGWLRPGIAYTQRPVLLAKAATAGR
jgi:hypothetical protein